MYYIIVVTCVPTSKSIFVVPVRFKPDEDKPIKEFTLLSDDSILVPESVNDGNTHWIL